MSTSGLSLNQAIAQLPPGTVGPCFPEDRAVIEALYHAVYPETTASDFQDDTWDVNVGAWGAYRDVHGVVRVAIFFKTDGAAHVFVKPEEYELAEIRLGFVMLAKDVCRVFACRGVTKLTFVYGESIRRFGEVLEQAGFSSKAVAVVQVVYFPPSGEADQAN